MTTKTSKKTKTKESTDKPQKKKFNFHDLTSKWTAIGFGIFLLAFISIFLYYKLTRPQSIAELLPADKTVGFVEININPLSGQLQELHSMLEPYGFYQQEDLLPRLEQITGIDFEKHVVPWLGRRISAALIAQKENAYLRHTPVFFIETRDQEATVKFLEMFALEIAGNDLVKSTYQRFPVYKYKLSHNIHFTFINNYLVASLDESGITAIIDAQSDAKDRVSNTPEFHKVRNNLPATNLIFSYINFHQASDALKRNPRLLQFKARELTKFEPYLSLYNSLGFVVVADDPSLSIQQFAYLDKAALGDKGFIESDHKYRPELSKYIEKEVSLYIGGQDITQQIQRLNEIFDQPNNSSEESFAEILHSLISNYLGTNVSIEEHLYPLLKGEYALVKGLSDEPNEYKLLIRFTEGEKDLSRFKIIMKNIQNVGARLDPQVVTRELPDGTTTQELVANTEAVTPSKSTHKDVEIQSYDLPNQEIGIHYAVIEDKSEMIAIIATTKESIVKSIDTVAGEANFQESDFYQNQINPLISSSDELAAVKISDFQLNQFSEYLKPLKFGVMSKNFFADGISTIYTFKLQ